MKIAKLISVAFIALGAFASAQEAKSPLSVHGMLRREVTSTIKDVDVDDYTPKAEFSTTSRLSGYNLGLGPKNLNIRLDAEYSLGDNGGLIFRYDEDKDDYLDNNNIQWAMGYMKLNDGMFEVSIGKLYDRYTLTKGLRFTGFYSDYGAAVTCLPVQGLALTARIASPDNKNSDYTKEFVAFSAGYENENFSVQGGYKLDKTGYYGFSVKAVENLTFIVDGAFALKDASGVKNDDGDDVFMTNAEIAAIYKVAPVNFGIRTMLRIAEDNNVFEFYPFVEVALNNVVNGLSAGLDFGYVIGDKDMRMTDKGPKIDGSMSITPEVTYRNRNVAVQGFYSYAMTPKNKDTARPQSMNHTFGLGFMYNF